MKLTDISWEGHTISVQQQKRDRFLKTPMPTEVGNAICRYILKADKKIVGKSSFTEVIFMLSGECCKPLCPQEA